MATSPYRSGGPLPSGTLDPGRARVGLLVGAVGALLCFASLLHAFFASFTATNGTMLSLGAAIVSVGLVYSSLDAPAGRVLLVLSAVLFSVTFVLRPMGGMDPRLFMRTWVWPVRYFAVAGAALGLLLRLRRSRSGTSGALLRLAAIVGTWWGIAWKITWKWADADHAQGAEALSRTCYLFLALGMLDTRRYLGIVPLQAPARTATDIVRDVATTRACLAALSFAAALAAPVEPWTSRWAVVVSAEAVSFLVLAVFHGGWLLRSRKFAALALSTVTIVIAMTTAALFFDSHQRTMSVISVVCFAVSALAFDGALAHATKPSKMLGVGAPPAFRIACIALTTRVAALVVLLRAL